MEKPSLYRGLWPQNVGKTAKYAVRIVDGKWKVTVTYDLGEGLMFLAVESGGSDVADRVNEIKRVVEGQEGGVFYINEYQHLLVPLARNGSSQYYSGGRVDVEFAFDFEGRKLTSRPVDRDGAPLNAGDPWVGPRPGIPYVLAAGGQDIYYESPALTDANPPEVRQGVTRKVQLSKVLRDKEAVRRALAPIWKVRGHLGGRFYVNEHSAIFTPVDKGDGNGLNYIYCGQIDVNSWFPQPDLG
jgi:hypothetical protein